MIWNSRMDSIMVNGCIFSFLADYTRCVFHIRCISPNRANRCYTTKRCGLWYGSIILLGPTKESLFFYYRPINARRFVRSIDGCLYQCDEYRSGPFAVPRSQSAYLARITCATPTSGGSQFGSMSRWCVWQVAGCAVIAALRLRSRAFLRGSRLDLFLFCVLESDQNGSSCGLDAAQRWNQFVSNYLHFSPGQVFMGKSLFGCADAGGDVV